MKMNVRVIDGLGYQMDCVNITHDPLDGLIIINHYGEPLHDLSGIIEVNLHKQTEDQKVFLGRPDNYVYQIL